MDNGTISGGAKAQPAPELDAWSSARAMLALQRKAVASSIIAIQEKGSKPPLYLVHGVGGGMLWGYNNLARCLGDDQPIFAFKSRGLDGLEEFGCIRDMAAQYVSDLRKFQLEGPYYLGGYCFGGNVAYEMASQLLAVGEDVAPLVLINAWAHNSSYTKLRWTPAFFGRFLWNLGGRLLYQVRCGAKRPRDYVNWRTAWLGKNIKALFSKRLEDKVAVGDLARLLPQAESERRLWRTHVQAWLEFRPRPCDSRVALFRTRGHPLVCSFDPAMGWGGFARRGVTVKMCRGEHESILENEHVDSAAAHIKAALEEAQNSGTFKADSTGKIAGDP
jgi:thioesterase domain-containing protein